MVYSLWIRLYSSFSKPILPWHKTERITRDDFSELLYSAWSRSDNNVQVATSTFHATGIYPLNMDAIPKHAYLLSCDQDVEQANVEQPDSPGTPSVTTLSTPPIPTTPAIQNPTTPRPHQPHQRFHLCVCIAP